MRSHLRILVAGSAALLSACSSTSTPNGGGNSQRETTPGQLTTEQLNAASDLLQSGAAQRIATGQYITPTALSGAVQQALNPGLSAYPDFVAGEAVRSQLSPDGNTLAVLCAGQNSLDNQAGNLDTPASTQFVFLYDVSGAHKQSPLLTQVLTPKNTHVGMVFSPDGSLLYVSGGRDDVVYVYAKSGGTWTASSTPIALNH